MLDDEIVAEIAQSYGQLKDRVMELEDTVSELNEKVLKLTEAVNTIIRCVVK